MAKLLSGGSTGDLGAPQTSGLLQAAHVQDAVVQMFNNSIIGFFVKKGAVDMDTIASEQGHSLLGDMTLDV